MTTPLEVRGLTKSFGHNRVLDDVAFTVDAGELCILLGPSGCGKTTLLRILAGLEGHEEGTIRFGDDEVSELEPRERDVAMVFQSYALYPHLSAYDNLAFPLRARRLDAEEIDRRVRRAARLLGIEELLPRRPRQLSGGQRQRVAIGRAIVREPRLFLFDEPLSNLDAALRSRMRVELVNLHRTLGATMVYVTHDQVEAMTLGQRIVLLEAGRVQQAGTPQDLYERPANLFVAGFLGSPQMNFFDGRLRRDDYGDDGVVFAGPGFKVPLEPARAGDLADGAEVVLGVRPEAVCSGAAAGGSGATGRLVHQENLGADVIQHLDLGAATLVLRTTPAERRELGTDVPYAFEPDQLHLFAAGRRVG